MVLEPVKDVTYRAYTTDYNKFQACIRESYENIFSWDNLDFIQKQHKQEVEYRDPKKIPLPVIPFWHKDNKTT